MFLPHLRALVSARGTTSIVAHLHTTRPIAADFASYGKTTTATSESDPDSGGTPPPTSTTPATDHTYTYAKQQDITPEPRVSHTGTRTYVVSPKDDTAPYDVPGGAYGSSDPYLTPPRTPAPQTSAPSSTSTSPAHFNTTSRVPHYPEGGGESVAARFRTAPGAMHSRGGSDGGLGLMGTSKSQAAFHPTDAAHTLAQRNLPPGAEGGIAGNNEAWKHRK